MLEQIQFKNILREWKNLPSIPEKKIYELWVKKIVSVKEFNTWYQYHNGYCVLDKSKEGIVLGFLVANPVINGALKYGVGVCPDGCQLLTVGESLQVERYRSSVFIYPFPSEMGEI